MKLEEQVVSLELSRRLKELGVEQKSICWWFLDERELFHVLEVFDFPAAENNVMNGGGYCPECAAFTVAEIGAMLPENRTRTMKIFGYWYCELYDYEGNRAALEPCLHRVVETSVADARGRLLLYLLENRYIKSEELGTK